MNLIIVESPTKARTISKFLGDDFIVTSSYGHIRDLPKGELGVDTEKNFEPKYIIPTKVRKKLNELKKEVANSNKIILATDEDREGEAISWHLTQALQLTKLKVKGEKLKVERIVFHEITKTAILNALKNPREINMDLVNAQQARRILDRLVGYKLSPFLWKKIIRGLSAGRVQSVAVRLIVEREREIEKFQSQEYFSIEAILKSKNIPEYNSNNTFIAYLYSKNNKPIGKLGITSKEKLDEILKELKNAKYKIANIEQKEKKRYPFPPFTTSTLQQASWAYFGYTAKRTMMLAQNLYERGHITYHRTDSLNLAQSAINNGRDYINKNFGKEYLPQTQNFYKTKSKGAQEAHEAIRPVSAEKNPEKMKLEGPQKKLYTLIWQRFLASQMTWAVYAATTLDIDTETQYILRATGQILKFDGFTKIYPIKIKENELPELEKNEILDLKKLEGVQHFTKPPARYTEASLIKILEQYGIGRPSTYAPTISTIQDRNYVQKNEQKRFAPNEIGFLVTDLLIEHFPNIIDINFTAKMEKDLDEIAKGKEKWQEVLKEFYEPFEKNLEKKYEEVKKANLVKKTDKICPECGNELVKRMGKFGWFYACSEFPQCKHTENIDQKKNSLEVHCPKCVEGSIIIKKTKRGKIFYGCSKYPKCDFALWDKPYIENIPGTKNTKKVITCSKCKSVMVEKNTKNENKVVCSNKKCKYKLTSLPAN